MLGFQVFSRYWVWTPLNVDVLEILQEFEILQRLRYRPPFVIWRLIGINRNLNVYIKVKLFCGLAIDLWLYWSENSV